MAGVTIYPMNQGATLPGSSNEYTNRNDTALRNVAYKDVSVNPLLKSVNIDEENSTSSTNTFVPSANFTEIRTTSHINSISNDFDDKIGNRILPKNATLTSYCLNREQTSSFKVKLYDSALSSSEINRRFTYASSDYPTTDEVGLNIDTYDYFILLNPEITTVGEDTIRPHFAKITRIISFDVFGDGIEFTPNYPSAVPKSTKVEIFKGPLKTDTEVVAISYGLRGDDASSSDKYDVENTVSLPTFYFYNDRLDTKNQLDYGTKYTVTVLRWWNYGGGFYVLDIDQHDQYVAGSGSKKITLQGGEIVKLVVGQSIFNHDDDYLGNIESINSSTSIYLDFARIEIDADSTNRTYKIGKSIRNRVFKTESKFGATIQNLGEGRLDATLQDLNKDYDEDNSNAFNTNRWQTAFANFFRHTSNLIGATSGTKDGNLTGPTKYLTFEKATYKNDKIPQVQQVVLNNPRNKMSKLARMTTMDTSGLQHFKVKEDSKLILQNSIYNSSFKVIATEGTVSRSNTPESTGILLMGSWSANNQTGPFAVDGIDPRTIFTVGETVYDDTGTTVGVIASMAAVSNYWTITFQANNAVALTNNENIKRIYTQKFTLSDIRQETDLRHNLTTNDIVEMDGYHYAINTVSAPSSGTQSFTIKDKKLKTANTWSSSNVGELISQKTLYLSPYSNGVLNFDLTVDTEIDYTTNRISLNGHTIEKEDAKLYDTRLVVGRFNSVSNKIDSADKDNKFAKMQTPNTIFYQMSGAGHIGKFYYYIGAYSISDVIFTGTVEDIKSAAKAGLTTYEITGRDETSKLLSTNINKSLNYYEDIVETTLPPKITATNITGIVGSVVSSLNSRNITWTSGTATPVPSKYGLILNQDNELVGEVSSYSGQTIVLEDFAYVTATSLKYFNPYDATAINDICGLKALGSNILHSNGIVDYSSISENGVVFDDGLNITYSSPTFSHTKLQNSSNISSYHEDKSLGYDISSPGGVTYWDYNASPEQALVNEDSVFSFALSDENGATVTKKHKFMANSESYDVIQVNEKSEGDTTLSIAPVFPIVLGRINSNTSDTRGTCNLYFVNSNMNTGGFVHRLQSKRHIVTATHAPKETFRYWDLQKFKAGTITKTFDSIYNEGKKPQALESYAVAYKIKANGYTPNSAIIDTPNNKPINGSNTIKGWTHLSNFYAATELIESYTPYQGGTTEYDIEYGALEQIDPRTDSYEFLATGDLFPNSKLRTNHLGYSGHSFGYSDLGIVLETDSTTTGSTEHEQYTGTTEQTLKTDSTYENNTIEHSFDSSPRADLRRYGIIRLVEATFDWHFNPVKFETLKPVNDIPLVSYFDYVSIHDPVVETSSNSITLTRGSDVNVTANSVSESDGDMFYSLDYIGENPDSQKLMGEYYAASNGFVAVKKTAAWGSADSGNHNLRGLGSTAVFDDLLRFDGHYANSAIQRYGVTFFPIFRTSDYILDNIDTRGANYKTDKYMGKKDIRFTNVFITRPDTKTTNFEFANLSGSNDAYNAHNVILPLISYEKQLSYSTANRLNKTCSLWNHSNSWLGSSYTADAGHELTMSRVVNALIERTRSAGTNISVKSKYGLGINAAANSDYFAHPYDNCIALFKDVELAMADNTVELPSINITSAPLLLDTDARYDAYIDDIDITTTTIDQNTRNSMTQQSGAYLIMGGTRTSANFLETLNTVSDDVYEHHTGVTGSDNKGLVVSAQMLVKPIFQLDDSTITLTNNSFRNETTAVFTLDNLSKHTWLSFMPNLTGYYLVSERLTQHSNSLTVNLRTTKHGGIPKHIIKIISHTVSQAPTDSLIEKHTIIFDDLVDVSANGNLYRLMKLDEIALENEVEYIEFNAMKRMKPAKNFKTGTGDGNDNFEFQESVYTMHLLLNLDSTTGKYLERRTGDTANDGFTHLEKMPMNFTDGKTSEMKTVTISTKRPTLQGILGEGFKATPTVATEDALIMRFDGTLKGNGIVSASKIIDIKLSRRPKLKDIKKCHIGTTYTVGSHIRKEVENIVKDAEFEYDLTKSFTIKTGNLVSSSTATTVVCQADAENIVSGDVIYSHDGHLIGEVTATPTNATIAISKRYYTPAAYDELIKIDDKTFVSTLKFDNTNVYATLNSLLVKKGMDYNIKNGKFSTRRIDDIGNIRKYALSYAESSNLISVSSNQSMFDKANRVVVIGDGVTYALETPVKGKTKEVKVTDPTIKTTSEAEIRAIELLELHSEDVRKINIVIQKEGMELIEAGDIVRLDFPNHNIPPADYMVFEIENVLAGNLSLIVGTFDKTIAERLAELSMSQSDFSISIFKKDSINVTEGKFLFAELNLNVIEVGYEITGPSNALSYNSNMGFDDLLGFTEEVGFEHTVVTKKSFDNKFYEQENYA